MVRSVQLVCVVLVAIAMALTLAHALELPGKMRLGKEAYLSVQQIYYPGFTVGGVAEPLGIIALLALLVSCPRPAAGSGGPWRRSFPSSPCTWSTGS
jgi:hypothetical protein